MFAVFTTLGIGLIVFGGLRRLWPCNPGQPDLFSKDTLVDVTYMLIGVVFLSGTPLIASRALLHALYGADAPRVLQAIQQGHGWLSHLPIPVQFVAVIFIVDVIQYWLHRAFHTRWLWPFHAVHHSAVDLDWTATFRNHPVNFVFYTTVAGVVILLVGLSPPTVIAVGLFNTFTAAMVHANVNWTFGPLRYVFASPVQHRWHHASDPVAHDMNFAPTFSFLDILFGTFYMPKGQRPEAYGAEDVPADVLGQLAHPFVAIGRMLGQGRSRRSPEATA